MIAEKAEKNNTRVVAKCAILVPEETFCFSKQKKGKKKSARAKQLEALAKFLKGLALLLASIAALIEAIK